jgi:Protein of unknown function (DUF1566)
VLNRFGWALAGALGLIAVLALARAIEAGPIDPPGPVGSTMRTLDELLPSWDRQLTAAGTDVCNSARFQCVFPDATYTDGAAVLDRETGLVWERVPTETTATWAYAVYYCETSKLGGRWAWRLPTLDELTSLLLSDGAGPFGIGPDPEFWSATGNALVPGNYLFVSFTGAGGLYADVPTATHRYWCVRGGTSHDPVQ